MPIRQSIKLIFSQYNHRRHCTFFFICRNYLVKRSVCWGLVLLLLVLLFTFRGQEVILNTTRIRTRKISAEGTYAMVACWIYIFDGVRCKGPLSSLSTFTVFFLCHSLSSIHRSLPKHLLRLSVNSVLRNRQANSDSDTPTTHTYITYSCGRVVFLCARSKCIERCRCMRVNDEYLSYKFALDRDGYIQCAFRSNWYIILTNNFFIIIIYWLKGLSFKRHK